MNTPTTTAVLAYTKSLSTFALVILIAWGFFMPKALAEWNFDFSRRAKPAAAADGSDGVPSGGASHVETYNDPTADTAADSVPKKGFIGRLIEGSEPAQETVILNTEKGFVPSSVRLRKGGRYLIHIVNVNEHDKNISFVMDAFGEHHATYYGKIKSFNLEPKKDGVFSFQCPETSAEGRLVVYSPAGGGSSDTPSLTVPLLPLNKDNEPAVNLRAPSSVHPIQTEPLQ